MTRRPRQEIRFSIVGLALGALVLALVCVADTLRPGASRSTMTSARSRVLHAAPVFTLSATQALQITVNAAASYDSTTRYWTYSYSVTNDPTSQKVLETFGVSPIPRPVNVGSPAHWLGSYGSDGDSVAVVWGVKDAGPAPPDWNGLNVYVSPYNTQPGQTTSGFKIISRQPPTNVTFYAQGFDTLQWGGEEEQPSPPTFFQRGVAGTTTGPDINSLVGVGDGPASSPNIEFRPPAPNPAPGRVSVAFYLPTPAYVKLGVFDLSGRRVRLLADGQYSRGFHSVSWNGLDSAGQQARPGVYSYKLLVDGQQAGQSKVTILK